MCRLSRNIGALTSWNPVGLFRPVMGHFLHLVHLTTLFQLNILWGSLCSVELYDNCDVQFQIIWNTDRSSIWSYKYVLYNNLSAETFQGENSISRKPYSMANFLVQGEQLNAFLDYWLKNLVFFKRLLKPIWKWQSVQSKVHVLSTTM